MTVHPKQSFPFPLPGWLRGFRGGGGKRWSREGGGGVTVSQQRHQSNCEAVRRERGENVSEWSIASEMCLFSLHGWQTQAEVPAPPCLTASEIPELRLKIVNAGKKRGKMCIRKTPSFSRKIIGNCVQKQKERRLVPVLSSGALVFGQIVD